VAQAGLERNYRRPCDHDCNHGALLASAEVAFTIKRDMTEPAGTQRAATGRDEDRLALFQSIYNRFVHLVLYARIGLGTWTSEDELAAFTVFMQDSILDPGQSRAIGPDPANE
jgi:hypothetical protein